MLNTSPTLADLYRHFELYVPNMLALFCDRIEIEGNCWIWQGAPTAQHGYGQLSIGPRCDRLVIYAHRASYMINCGDPGELFVIHKCPHSLCINPDHLFAGLAADKTAQMMRAGRQRNQNTERTHCRNGHALMGDNVRVEGGRFRRCIECQRNRRRR